MIQRNIILHIAVTLPKVEHGSDIYTDSHYVWAAGCLKVNIGEKIGCFIVRINYIYVPQQMLFSFILFSIY